MSTGLARGRLFVEEVPCRIERSTTSDRPLSRRRTAASHIATTVGVEAFVPRGARAEYGLLVVEYVVVGHAVEHVPSSKLAVDVGSVSASSKTWDEALCRATEVALVGLPLEYAPAVMDGLADGVALGDVRVVGAAHGAIGSSPAFFTRLARWVVCLLADEERAWLREGFDHAPMFRRFVVDGLRD